MTDWTLLPGGAILLYLGAEWFVGGASALALALRVSKLVVGLTVVAFGTSAPEVVVGIDAAAAGHGAVALGNVVGSNIANIGLILGVAVLIRPAPVPAPLPRRELPVLVASTLLVPLLLLDGAVGRGEAGLLLAAAVAYLVWMVRASRAGAALAQARKEARVAAAAADAAGAPAPRSPLRAAATAAAGLALLLFGGHLFVGGAVAVAVELGMSDRLVGLTIVAIGTSLPELVTSAIAAHRGHADLAVGNVVGSNIFNVLVCLSSAALVGRVAAPLRLLWPDVAALLVLTALLAVFLRAERTVSRVEAALALALYVAYLTTAVVRG